MAEVTYLFPANLDAGHVAIDKRRVVDRWI